MNKIIQKILFVFLLFIALPVNAYYNPGTPRGFVNDYADMIPVSDEQALESKLVNFEKESSNEISVVTIPDLDGDTIENFAVELFQDWGIGKKGKDNGVLVLVARDDRKMRIEVGYGLEGALTDAQSYWIIDDVMKPAFQAEDYYLGIDEAVDKIIAATEGEYIPESTSSDNGEAPTWFVFVYLIIFAWLWLASVLGRSKSWWLGGVIGGIVGIVLGLLVESKSLGIISALVLIPIGLLFDYIVSKSYHKHKSVGDSIPWWIGGGRGGGSSSSGFGGFGGGSSGGGGASGGW